MGSHLVPGRSWSKGEGHGRTVASVAGLQSWVATQASGGGLECLLPKIWSTAFCLNHFWGKVALLPEEVCIHIFLKRTKSRSVPGILNEPPQLSSVKSAVWRNPAISTLSLSPHYCLLDYKKHTFSQIPFEELLWKRLRANTSHLPHTQQILQWSRNSASYNLFMN